MREYRAWIENPIADVVLNILYREGPPSGDVLIGEPIQEHSRRLGYAQGWKDVLRSIESLETYKLTQTTETPEPTYGVDE